jgi:hypothetical protein
MPDCLAERVGFSSVAARPPCRHAAARLRRSNSDRKPFRTRREIENGATRAPFSISGGEGGMAATRRRRRLRRCPARTGSEVLNHSRPEIKWGHKGPI